MGNNGKQAKIKTILTVGVTDEIRNALEIASEWSGTTCSQLARQAILEKMVREGFMRHPMQQPAHAAE
jgi:hypothetical protein